MKNLLTTISAILLFAAFFSISLAEKQEEQSTPPVFTPKTFDVTFPDDEDDYSPYFMGGGLPPRKPISVGKVTIAESSPVKFLMLTEPSVGAIKTADISREWIASRPKIRRPFPGYPIGNRPYGGGLSRDWYKPSRPLLESLIQGKEAAEPSFLTLSTGFGGANILEEAKDFWTIFPDDWPAPYGAIIYRPRLGVFDSSPEKFPVPAATVTYTVTVGEYTVGLVVIPSRPVPTVLRSFDVHNLIGHGSISLEEMEEQRQLRFQSDPLALFLQAEEKEKTKHP